MRFPFLGLVILTLSSIPSIGWTKDIGIVGHHRIFTNDYFGDGRDRWRTSSYSLSYTLGDKDELEYGDLRPSTSVELRLRAEIIAPADLTDLASFDDRPYVGIIALGAFKHIDWRNNEVAFGGELVFTGPQTGIGDYQAWAHSGIGATIPAGREDQFPNGIYPSAFASIARQVKIQDRFMARPYFEAQAGYETFARAGADFFFGNDLSDRFLQRASTTGHLQTGIKHRDTYGATFVVGGDVTYVSNSVLLPESQGYKKTPIRTRARLGILASLGKGDLFYGWTLMSKEFEKQKQPQALGSISIHFKF